ncbi:glycoside hydrolase family 97 protein [Segatella maculosa]|uniref:glycoside hydrolase family 97 protein n=1 Tax=Segatella maculosa TaxID=439703 RepID=UPI0023F53453|nr:glycoside hydrolase family 97 protein [Segatella maculosa]
MKKNLLFALGLCLSMGSFADNHTVCSPDGKLMLTISKEGGRPSYTVSYDGVEVLRPSALGLTADYGDFTQGMKLVKATEKRIQVSYDMTRTKRAHVSYGANQLTLDMVNAKGFPLQITFNVANNDVAYRYTLLRPKSGTPRCAVIRSEASGFNLPDETRTFLTPQIQPMTGWERTKPSYEEEYRPDARLADKSAFGVGYTFPCLYRIPNGKADTWLLISETGTEDYPGCRLSEYEPGKGYHVAYPQPGENNGVGSEYAAVPLPWSTPWRTITVGHSLQPIVESTVPYDVVGPRYEAKAEYKPGRYTWSWILWMDESCNYDDQVRFIDVASKMGYEYILVDALWDKQIGYDRIEQLSRYAQSKGVGLMLWYNSNGTANDAPQGPRNVMNNPISRKRDMAWMQRIGVKAIKVDFFGGDKQQTLQLYRDILSDANDYGLQVIFHGCTLPRGWERMYPNFVASEAALASENVYFTDYHAKREAFELTMYPFTRNAVAAFDWGGVLMNRYMSKDNKSRHQRFTGDIFEMATAITNQTSVNCVALTPDVLATLPAFEIEWLIQLPTAWSDLRFLGGYPGKFFAVARQTTAGKWYAAAINADPKPLTLTLDLPMFAGKVVKVYADGPKKKGSLWLTPGMKQQKVRRNGRLMVTVQPNGGVIVNE